MDSTDTKESIDILKRELRSTAKQVLNEVFDHEIINLIAAPGDSPLCIYAAAAGKHHILSFSPFKAWPFPFADGMILGYPIATVPIGQLRYNNRPFGYCIVAKDNKEETLLRFMSAYEKVSRPRPVPNI